MKSSPIEAILASPPERDELVVQLFVKDEGQWGEVYREDDEYWIDLYASGAAPLCFKLDELIRALERSKAALSERL